MAYLSKIASASKSLIPLQSRSRLRETFGLNRDQWCRVVMNREIKKFLQSLECSRLNVLEISGQRKEDFNFQSYRTLEYPDYDVCAGPFVLECYDLIIAEQVFEHIRHPDRAALHIFQMLRPGGIFIISTPFLLKIHPYPMDFYRWTEDGIRTLLESAGFSILQTSSWGNRQCLRSDLRPGMKWTTYVPIIHSLKNEPQLPIVIWAFARKM
jgi:SAM-dependent methyltransferase